MNKQRLQHFDVIKGIAILLVVMGHVLIMGIHGLDKAFIFKFIEKLHMPLFFFISGYFTFKMTDNKVVLPNLWLRFKQLIVPFICVSSIWIYYFPHSGIQSPLDSTWSGLYSNVWKNGYWFTLCLFEIILIYYLLAAISNKFKGKSLRIILLVIGYIMLYITTNISDFSIEKYLGIELIVKFMPIFIIGAFAHEYKNKFNAIIASDKLLTLSIILGGISIYYTCYFWEFPEIYTKYQILISIISHIALIIIVFNIVKAWCETKFHSLASSWIIKKLQFIGKESLSIYLLHYFFLFPITWLRQPMVDMGLGFTPLFVISLLVAIIIIAITLGASHIISRSKLLSVFLLGKN